MNDHDRRLAEYLEQDIRYFEKKLLEDFKKGPAVGLTPAEMAEFLSRNAE